MDAKLAEYLKSDQPATIFEIYIKGGPKNEPGWDIRHVVVPFTGAEAIAAVKRYPKFDEIITRNDWFHKDQAVAFPSLEAFGG